jgi:hypothetical protein
VKENIGAPSSESATANATENGDAKADLPKTVQPAHEAAPENGGASSKEFPKNQNICADQGGDKPSNFDNALRFTDIIIAVSAAAGALVAMLPRASPFTRLKK